MKNTKIPRILSSDELAVIFDTAQKIDRELIVPIALQALAGLRIAELNGFKLTGVDIKGKRIVIRETKTRSCRLIENVPDAIWEWLKLSKSQGLLDIPSNFSVRLRRVFDVAGVEYGRSMLRTSFATHLFVLAGNADWIGRVLGLRVSTVFRLFPPLGKLVDAKAYFEVKPRK